MAEAAHHRPLSPPSDESVRAGIGTTAWKRYKNVLTSLAELGLEPEFYWYSESGGWTVRFQINHKTGCAIYLSKPPIGLVTVGRNTESALQDGSRARARLVHLVSATPRRGQVRWVKVPLATQAEANTFLSLVRTKMEVATRVLEAPPEPAKEPEKKKARATTPKPKKTKKAAAKKVSRKPRQRTTPASKSRKTTGKSSRRSTARRSSRG